MHSVSCIFSSVGATERFSLKELFIDIIQNLGNAEERYQLIIMMQNSNIIKITMRNCCIYWDPYDYTITGIKQDFNNLSLKSLFSESLPSKSRNALLYQGKYNITGEFYKNDVNSFNVEAQVRF